MVEASAPAKVILFGEHAVVYGKPAIAVPVSSLRVNVRVIESEQDGIAIVTPLLNEVLRVDDTDVDNNPLVTAVRYTLDALQIRQANLTLQITSQIPVASGLGSGAAVSAAIVRGLAQQFGRALEDEVVNELVFEVEKLYHGTPSGVDNTVIVYEQPVYFVKGQPIERLVFSGEYRLLIADTGKAALTRVAVGDVRKLYEREPERIQPVLDEIGEVVVQARLALEAGDSLTVGKLMWRNHELLDQLTVSSAELDALVAAARNAGALGAKLSGGGRGGNMIALVTEETRSEVREALIAAGAVRVFETVVA